MAAARQWASTTPCRIATDPYSWMQAVHWIAGSGIHQPRRGPRFGETTVRIAQLLAELTPCRPGIDYLIRRSGLSERTVQYHLAALRDMGLLAYTVRGSRRKGATALASEFTRVIPPVFDEALGIRIVGEGSARRPVGIAEENRGVIAKLAKLAARKRRKTRSKKSRAAGARCTPMQGGYSTGSSAGDTHSPSEKNVASGKSDHPTPKKAKRGPRTLNKVGRRRQLGSELVRRVPWLAGAHPARVSWVAKDVADAGWTADEVIAWLDNGDAPGIVHRPVGFLANRLKGATAIWADPKRRAHAVEAARDSRRAEQARHTEWDGAWTGPKNPAVQRLVEDACEQMWGLPKPSAPVDELPVDDFQIRIEDFTRDEVIDMRAAAQRNPDVIRAAIDTIGEPDARRLFTNHMVDQVLNGPRLSAFARLHV